jgi:LysM repeat protein
MDTRIASQNDLILHTVKKGETVSKISSLYQVPEELIVAWNGLPSVHKITAGQQLALYMNSTSAGTVIAKRSPTKSTPSSNIIVLSDIKKQAIPEKQPQDIYSWYLVRNGDSLWTISRRFKTSPDDIKRWNNLKSNLIHPGSRLKLRDV